MTVVGIVGAGLLGAGVGGALGAWYGFSIDKSDLPMYHIFTTPTGALIGAFVGVAIGATILT